MRYLVFLLLTIVELYIVTQATTAKADEFALAESLGCSVEGSTILPVLKNDGTDKVSSKKNQRLENTHLKSICETANLAREILNNPSDSDNDGLPDIWELKFFANLSLSGDDDPDKDKKNNATEFIELENPTSKKQKSGLWIIPVGDKVKAVVKTASNNVVEHTSNGFRIFNEKKSALLSVKNESLTLTVGKRKYFIPKLPKKKNEKSLLAISSKLPYVALDIFNLVAQSIKNKADTLGGGGFQKATFSAFKCGKPFDGAEISSASLCVKKEKKVDNWSLAKLGEVDFSSYSCNSLNVNLRGLEREGNGLYSLRYTLNPDPEEQEKSIEIRDSAERFQNECVNIKNLLPSQVLSVIENPQNESLQTCTNCFAGIITEKTLQAACNLAFAPKGRRITPKVIKNVRSCNVIASAAAQACGVAQTTYAGTVAYYDVRYLMSISNIKSFEITVNAKDPQTEELKEIKGGSNSVTLEPIPLQPPIEFSGKPETNLRINGQLAFDKPIQSVEGDKITFEGEYQCIPPGAKTYIQILQNSDGSTVWQSNESEVSTITEIPAGSGVSRATFEPELLLTPGEYTAHLKVIDLPVTLNDSGILDKQSQIYVNSIKEPTISPEPTIIATPISNNFTTQKVAGVIDSIDVGNLGIQCNNLVLNKLRQFFKEGDTVSGFVAYGNPKSFLDSSIRSLQERLRVYNFGEPLPSSQAQIDVALTLGKIKTKFYEYISGNFYIVDYPWTQKEKDYREIANNFFPSRNYKWHCDGTALNINFYPPIPLKLSSSLKTTEPQLEIDQILYHKSNVELNSISSLDIPKFDLSSWIEPNTGYPDCDDGMAFVDRMEEFKLIIEGRFKFYCEYSSNFLFRIFIK